jgi:hypothetical protein
MLATDSTGVRRTSKRIVHLTVNENGAIEDFCIERQPRTPSIEPVHVQGLESYHLYHTVAIHRFITLLILAPGELVIFLFSGLPPRPPTQPHFPGKEGVHFCLFQNKSGHGRAASFDSPASTGGAAPR